MIRCKLEAKKGKKRDIKTKGEEREKVTNEREIKTEGKEREETNERESGTEGNGEEK